MGPAGPVGPGGPAGPVGPVGPGRGVVGLEVDGLPVPGPP